MEEIDRRVMETMGEYIKKGGVGTLGSDSSRCLWCNRDIEQFPHKEKGMGRSISDMQPQIFPLLRNYYDYYTSKYFLLDAGLVNRYRI